MRAPNARRTVITIAIWMLCVGLLPAADDLAPAGDPSSPASSTSGQVYDDFSRPGYEDPWRVPIILPGITSTFDVIDIIVRQDGRLNAGDLLNQGPREDVVEPGDPCNEGSVGSLVMCRN